jgi:hypothetical protein
MEDQTITEIQGKDGDKHLIRGWDLNLLSSVGKISHHAGFWQGHYLHWHAPNIDKSNDGAPSSSVPTFIAFT